MPRRRFTKEQREKVLATRAKQRKACGHGNHWWYPGYHFDLSERSGLEPRLWSTNERYPMPVWNKKAVICTACNLKGSMGELTTKKQKKMRDIFNGFVENTLTMRKDREQELKPK